MYAVLQPSLIRHHQPNCCPAPFPGLILQFDLFKKNDYGILFFLFFLFQMAMNSLAYALSTVIRKSQTAVYTGFLIFLVGWICQVCHQAVTAVTAVMRAARGRLGHCWHVYFAAAAL